MLRCRCEAPQHLLVLIAATPVPVSLFRHRRAYLLAERACGLTIVVSRAPVLAQDLRRAA